MRDSIPKIIILIGPPGSGKGTQAKLLVEKLGLEYFGSGEALRKRQKVDDFTGKKITEAINRGDWLSPFVISKIWTDKFEQFKQKRKFKGFVSDGSPRTMLEAKFFDEALSWYEWQEKAKFIFINISRKESVNRLIKRRQCKQCGRIIPWVGELKKLRVCDECGGSLIMRTDDHSKVIKKRLKEFKNKTMPVIKHYKKKNKLIEINGEQSIEDVFKDILKVL